MATKRDNKTGADKSNRKENQQAGMEAISAIDLLEEDHRLVEGFFDEYEKLEAAPEKQQLGLKICLALQVHAQIEEEIVVRKEADQRIETVRDNVRRTEVEVEDEDERTKAGTPAAPTTRVPPRR